MIINEELMQEITDKLANRFLVFFSALITSAVTLVLLYCVKWFLGSGIVCPVNMKFILIFSILVAIPGDIIMSLHFGKYLDDTLSDSKFQTLYSILYSIVHSMLICTICSFFVSAALSILFAVVAFSASIFIQFSIRIRNGEKINFWLWHRNKKLLFSL